MTSSIKNPNKRTLYFILPFIVVLLPSTFGFAQSQTSFPITITSAVETAGGNIKLQNQTNNFSGTIGLSFYQPNANGCYVSFSGDDGTTICIDRVAEVQHNTRPSDAMRQVGTGTIMIPIGGVVQSGTVYIDMKGTWHCDCRRGKVTLPFTGKIGGGGQGFVIAGTFQSTLSGPLDCSD